MKRISFEYPEIDSLQLQQRLKDYAAPRDRVTKLLSSGDLVRIKKGLYVDPHSQYKYSKEILANLVYGPSYVSLEYALRYHNLIPEAVRVVTSVTTGRKRRYSTPVGDFDYAHMPQRFYSPGVMYQLIDGKRAYMIASPEKALFDMLYLRYPDIKESEFEAHIFENMRIDESDFARLDFSILEAVLSTCRRRSIVSLRRFISTRAHHG